MIWAVGLAAWWWGGEVVGWRGSEAPRPAPVPSVAIQMPGRPQPGETTLSLAAVGDILLDRGVGERIRRYGSDYPFKHVAGILSAADIAFGNLECPLSECGVKVAKRYSFRAQPAAVECLTLAGLDVLSLANNHTMDCGRAGLVETMECLAQAGLRWCGGGQSAAEAEAATMVEVNGIRVAFVAFCDFLPEGSFLRGDRPTIAFSSEGSVRRAVSAAKAQADVVVASFHWGSERTPYRTERQTALAHAAIKAGASLVLGHHPHALQRLEVIRPGTLIAYSLGNFVFDGLHGPSAESVILRCRLSRRGVVSADVVPIRIEGARPRPEPPGLAAHMLRPLGRRSSEGAILPAREE